MKSSHTPSDKPSSPSRNCNLKISDGCLWLHWPEGMINLTLLAEKGSAETRRDMAHAMRAFAQSETQPTASAPSAEGRVQHGDGFNDWFVKEFSAMVEPPTGKEAMRLAWQCALSATCDAHEINDALDVAECCVHDQVKNPLEREHVKDGLKKIRALALRSAHSATRDSERLDWLERFSVEVRTPLVHGSRQLFLATPNPVEGAEDEPSDIRAQIDYQRNGGARRSERTSSSDRGAK